MKLLLVEPEATGHRMVLYARLVAKEAMRRNWSLSLMTTEKAMRHPAFELFKAACGGNLEIVIIKNAPIAPGFSSMRILSRQNQYFLAIAECYKQLLASNLPDLIYMSNLDLFDKILSLRGSPFGKTPYCGMMMNIKFHRHDIGTGPRRRSDRFFRYLFKRLLGTRDLRGVSVVDESFVDYTKEHPSPFYSKVHYVPDAGHLNMVETRTEARRILGIPPRQFVVLVYGALAKRKGIGQLAQAVQALKRVDIAILLAGAKDRDIEGWLQTSAARSLTDNGQLFQSDGFHDELEEQRVFCAANAAWIGYIEGFTGSSGVMYQAGAAGLPVIATRHGLIGWQAQRYRSGLTVDPMQVVETSRAIESLVTDEQLYSEYSQNGKTLARTHSPEAFATGVCNMLENLV